MFTNPLFYEWLVLIAAGVLIVIGLTYLTLRRRDEMLEEIFTPVEQELAQEFFERIEAQERAKQEHPEEETVEEATEEDDTDWGDLPPGL